MGHIRGILKNAGFLAFARIAQPAFSFILILFIARLLGAEVLGAYDLVLSYLAVFQTVAALGFKYLVVRDLAKKKTDPGRYLLHVCAASLPMAVLSALLMAWTVEFLGYGPDIRTAVAIAGFALAATVLIENCEGVFTGLENLRPYATAVLVENLVRVVLSVAAVLLESGFVTLVLIFATTRFLGLGLNLYMLRGTIFSAPVGFELSFVIKLIRSTAPFAGIVFLATLYAKADVLMLSKMRNLTEVGIYTAAYRFIIVIQMLLASFSTSLFPVLSRLHKSSPEEFASVSTSSIHQLLCYVLPVACITSLLAGRIMPLSFGAGFEASVQVLQILIWSVVPFVFITVADYILLSTHNQVVDLKINLYATVCNMTLNLLLIPHFGAVGAAAATFLSTVMYLAIQHRFLSRRVVRLDLVRIFARPVAAGAVMVAVFFVLQPMSLAVAVAGALFGYLMALAGLKSLSATMHPSKRRIK